MNQYSSLLRLLKLKNIVFRREYLRWYGFIENAQWWGKEENDNYQWKKVKALLKYSWENIPYYREVFNKMGAKPGDIKTWSDFTEIPYLTKEIIRERPDDFIPGHIKNRSKLQCVKTSGSTGQPLEFYVSPENDAIERAFMFQQWKRVGYCENSSRIILRGEPVKNNRLFERYRFTNDWAVSSYHLSKPYIKQYVDFLDRIKPDFFHVYPSSLYIFTQLLLESELKLDFAPKAILSGSEQLHDYQRDLFEKTYNTRVYSWLGLTEGTIMAGECEHSKLLHVWPQYSYVELIDNNGKHVDEKGSTGSIIGTNLNSFVTPFIRYKSGDMATYGGTNCSLCGREHMILDSIEGREQSIIILADGSELPFLTLGFFMEKDFKAFMRIKMIQLVQDIKGEVLIKINPTKDFSGNDELEIKTKLRSKVNNKLSIRFEYTEDFVRSKSGKYLEVVQRVKKYSLDLMNSQ